MYIFPPLSKISMQSITQHQCDADETIISSRCLIRISGQGIAGNPVFREAPTLVEKKNKRKKTIGTHRGGQLTNETGNDEGGGGKRGMISLRPFLSSFQRPHYGDKQ